MGRAAGNRERILEVDLGLRVEVVLAKVLVVVELVVPGPFVERTNPGHPSQKRSVDHRLRVVRQFESY